MKKRLNADVLKDFKQIYVNDEFMQNEFKKIKEYENLSAFYEEECKKHEEILKQYKNKAKNV